MQRQSRSRVCPCCQVPYRSQVFCGNRPGFSAAARPELAIPLYERFVADLRAALGPDRVGTGRFGAYMKVALENDGPFSVELVEP